MIDQSEWHIKQCETCIFVEKRTCMYHGYPKQEITPSCEYKVGVFAEEALRNMKVIRSKKAKA